MLPHLKGRAGIQSLQNSLSSHDVAAWQGGECCDSLTAEKVFL